ncbi:uncharacterized protein LOC128997350 [Macrosteles quadrilineatus]|uniref:uncharacterized protein LOC128997349 n=1 Tax=Macrosteles quadrilineatus TaxID=74068 RepID=UPI0023E1F26C|nr:uncharacterized protein LOC128997349 [Macrosteles quadrilineatus]XP_054278963.1 uncharacterized protein LOC128997350 [Macrosteles quadrilineatus]
MKLILFGILLFVECKALPTKSARFKDSYLDDISVEDVVSDLANRQKVVVRDWKSDVVSVYNVEHDRETKLPYVTDPLTALPYLLYLKVQEWEPQLFRMIRGKNHQFVVTNTGQGGLYRPVINRLGEVDLKKISEEEAGFTTSEALQI